MFRGRFATYFAEYVPPSLCMVEADPAADPAAGGGGAVDPNLLGGEGGDKPLLDTGLADGEGGDDGTPQVSWPDDWREKFAGGDDKALARAKRYASPENVFKALVQAQDRLRSGQITALPEDATAEEVAAYRKNMGVPEKPDGYGFAYPEELKPSERDTATLTAFQQHMHERHVSPTAAKAAFEFYTNQIRADQEAKAERQHDALLENMAELRKDFPRKEVTRNLTIASEFLEKHFDTPEAQIAIKEVLDLRLPSGVRVVDYAPFLRGLFSMARAQADEEALFAGDGAGGGKSVDDEYNDLITKSVEPGQKLTSTERTRLEQLAETRATRELRGAGRRAA